MELRQLRYFVAVAETGSFTRAAAQCRVAQPSLSQQIRKLEDEFGETLFRRKPRRVELTTTGEEVYRRAKHLLAQAGELAGLFTRQQEHRHETLAVGFIPTIAPYLLPSVVARFMELSPGASVMIREGRTDEVLDWLLAGEVELAVASDIRPAEQRRAEWHVRELFQEALLLAVPRHHLLAFGRKPLPLAEVPRDEVIVLSEGHCLGDQTLRLCRMRRENARLECGHLDSLQAMVAAGLGIGFVPEMSARRRPMEGVVYRRLGQPEPRRVVSIVRRRGRDLTRPASRFVEALALAAA